MLCVRNPGPVAHSCVLTASLPLPRQWGARALADLHVGAAPAQQRPLLRWPDGSLAVVQVQWHAVLPAGYDERVVVRCVPRSDAPPAEAAPAPREADPWPAPLPLHAEVIDPWGRTYRAHFPVLREVTRGLVRQQHGAAVHIEPDTGATLFAAELFFTTRQADSLAELVVVLDNARTCRAMRIGPARLTRFSLITHDRRLRLRPQFAAENLLPPPVAVHDAAGAVVGYRHDLLGPSAMLYLGDGTAKAFTFDVCWDDDLSPVAQAAIETRTSSPPHAIADLDWVRATAAFGLFGGPAPLLAQGDEFAALAAGTWRAHAQFGPFGDFGVDKEAAALASAHHLPMALHDVVRWRAHDLLRIGQMQVRQGMLRPLPGHRSLLPPHSAGLRQGLSTRAMQRPHGFAALDYEHVAVERLFDLWWLTGDELVRQELVRHGQAIEAMLVQLPFTTSRGEGRCAQALAAIAWATDDAALLARAVRRVHEHVLPRLADSELVALAQPPHAEVFGGEAWFDAPWQMAALVHGLCALHRRSGDPALAAAAVEVARRMATHGWVEGQGPKYFVHAHDPQQFLLARGLPPLLGTAHFAIGAYVLAAELAHDDADLRLLFWARADSIVHGTFGKLPLPPQLGSDPWLQLWLDRK
jgi:hypothetical protein